MGDVHPRWTPPISRLKTQQANPAEMRLNLGEPTLNVASRNKMNAATRRIRLRVIYPSDSKAATMASAVRFALTENT